MYDFKRRLWHGFLPDMKKLIHLRNLTVPGSDKKKLKRHDEENTLTQYEASNKMSN